MDVRVAESPRGPDPSYCSGLAIFCDHFDSVNRDQLQIDLDRVLAIVRAKLTVDLIGEVPTVAAARGAVRHSGRSPSRHRASAEALLRRVLRGEELRDKHPLIALNLLLTMRSLCPVGTYDMSSISSDVVLTEAATGASLASLAGAELDVSGLPVLADSIGPFGTILKDSTRTSITDSTQSLLVFVFTLGCEVDMESLCDQVRSVLVGSRGLRHKTL